MKHSKETSGFSSDSLPSPAPPSPAPPSASSVASGIRRGDTRPFAFAACAGAAALHWPPRRCLAAGETDLRPDLSPGSRRIALQLPLALPLGGRLLAASRAERVLATAPSAAALLAAAPLRQPTLETATDLSRLAAISAGAERLRRIFAGDGDGEAEEISSLLLLPPSASSAPALSAAAPAAVEAERLSLTLQASDACSDLSSQPFILAASSPSSLPSSVFVFFFASSSSTSSASSASSLASSSSSTLGLALGPGRGRGVSESTSLTVSSSGDGGSLASGFAPPREASAFSVLLQQQPILFALAGS